MCQAAVLAFMSFVQPPIDWVNCASHFVRNAATAAGIGKLGTHTMRHTFRSWLDSVGTPVGVQQGLMRHADIRTTMNIYGDAGSEEMSQARGKIADLALNGR
jgi:integrase